MNHTMIKGILAGGLAGVVLGLSGAAAQTASDPMAGYYGNTLIFGRPDAAPSETHMWIKPDKTFTSISISQKDGHFVVRMGEGNWEVQNGRFCRINNTRTPPTNSCDNPLNSGEPGHKVGDKWQNVTRDGKPEIFEVVAGQQ